MIDENGKEFEGYISSVMLPNGKMYKLRCEVVEVYPITCPKCGASFELKYGSGRCDHCGTYFTTKFSLQEGKQNDITESST